MSEGIRGWLEQHGLGKYAQGFEENEIGLADLSLLTDNDLREMGLPIGPRRRFLALVNDEAESVETDASVAESFAD